MSKANSVRKNKEKLPNSALEMNRNSSAVDSAFKTESDVLNQYDQFIDKTRDQIIEMDYLEDEEDNPKEKDPNNQSEREKKALIEKISNSN